MYLGLWGLSEGKDRDLGVFSCNKIIEAMEMNEFLGGDYREKKQKGRMVKGRCGYYGATK